MADFMYECLKLFTLLLYEDKSLNRVESAVTGNELSSKVLNVQGVSGEIKFLHKDF